MNVTLTWYEVAIGAYVGIQRQIAALSKRLPDRHGYIGDGWSEHIEGACGEMAAARAIGQYWTPSVNTFKNGGDVGEIQVRTRSNHEYDLLIRNSDRDDDIFILVTGKVPSFVVRGWLRGSDCKKQEWLKEYGGRPPAWFVPQGSLNSVDHMRGNNDGQLAKA
jgi:hypothetical protein